MAIKNSKGVQDKRHQHQSKSSCSPLNDFNQHDEHVSFGINNRSQTLPRNFAKANCFSDSKDHHLYQHQRHQNQRVSSFYESKQQQQQRPLTNSTKTLMDSEESIVDYQDGSKLNESIRSLPVLTKTSLSNSSTQPMLSSSRMTNTVSNITTNTNILASTNIRNQLQSKIDGPLEQCSISSTLTIRRLLQLYDLGEFHEAAQIITRLPYSIFRSVVLDLPIDLFVEAIPSSLPILDALYAKVFFSGRDILAFGFKFLHPENVVSHLIKMFAICDVHSHPTSYESISICKKLLKIILIADPSLRKQLLIKKALIDRAVEGMGHHGLVGTSNDALMNLHEALKLEFERVIQQYKSAIAKIDELSMTNAIIKDGGPITRSLSQGPAPTFSSHQRLLSLKQEEIQDRLNKNRSLLCALEPCFRTNHSLQILLAILQKRIDYDKETLFQFCQLSKEYSCQYGNVRTSSLPSAASAVSSTSSSIAFNDNDHLNSSSQSNRHHHQHSYRQNCSNSSTTSSQHQQSTRQLTNQTRSFLSNQFERDSVVAPVLMRFSHGCNQILNLLKEIHEENSTKSISEEQNQQRNLDFLPKFSLQDPLADRTESQINSLNESNYNCDHRRDDDFQSPLALNSETIATMASNQSTKPIDGHQHHQNSTNDLNSDRNDQNQTSPSSLSNFPSNHQITSLKNTKSVTNRTGASTSTTTTTAPMVIPLAVTDDSSDISGYHSDSDMSPISTQSPSSSNNNRILAASAVNSMNSSVRAAVDRDQNDPNDQMIGKNIVDSNCSVSKFIDPMDLVNYNVNNRRLNNNGQSSELPSTENNCNVAILTGHTNATTLMDGEVTVNGGSIATNSTLLNQKCFDDSFESNILCSCGSTIITPRMRRSEQQSSICRIEVNGKTKLVSGADCDDNGADDVYQNMIDPEAQTTKQIESLQSQLERARSTIKQLELIQDDLRGKLIQQSKQTLNQLKWNDRDDKIDVDSSHDDDDHKNDSNKALSISNQREFFENFDETNQTNALIRQYESLYSQVRMDVIDALNQFDELKESNELKIKLLLSIFVNKIHILMFSMTIGSCFRFSNRIKE
ncbi:hypothetical protein SSS_03783 [Sarcoptes scabiei]|uniref:Uncharacterized protein n=1 Tax=Sarcoptes scabiei TaxID=52283 RepID=A0A834R5G5_SARSC|nr:hypothetical protein SSS_03783 [Sarcoptes scabiei]